MVITYKDLQRINFPVYGLKDFDLIVQDGLVLGGGCVVDDRNQIGETLGIRRLQTPHKTLPLRRSYKDVAAFLIAKDKYFIDSLGYCFIYQKTKYVKIKYHKILNTTVKDTYTTLRLDFVPFPIILQRPPPTGKTWVGLIYFDKTPWLPYEFSETKYADKRKKI